LDFQATLGRRRWQLAAIKRELQSAVQAAWP
jgi:hypothetical protein